MAWKISNRILNQMLAGIKAELQDGVILIYSGSQPASANDAPSGTLLGRVTVNAGAWTAGQPTNGLEFGTPTGRQIQKSASETWQFAGLADGQAGWFRFVGNAADSEALDASETYPRIDGRIATSGADMNLSNISIVIGAITTIDSFTLR